MARVTQAHVEARTEDILAAAVRLFGSRGIEKTTMADIAAEAGLSAGAIYRYFPGKEALLDAVFEAAVRENAANFEAAAAASTSPMAALFSIGEAVTRGEGKDCSMWLEAMLAGIRDPEHIGKRHRTVTVRIAEQIEQLLRAGQASGELDPALDAHALSLLLLAYTQGMQIMVAEAQSDEPARQTMPIFRQLLRPPAH
jgi:AcrR family transcriptional regulator